MHTYYCIHVDCVCPEYFTLKYRAIKISMVTSSALCLYIFSSSLMNINIYVQVLILFKYLRGSDFYSNLSQSIMYTCNFIHWLVNQCVYTLNVKLHSLYMCSSISQFP